MIEGSAEEDGLLWRWFYQPQTRIVEIDLSDPFNLEITSEMTITGIT